MYEYTKNFAHSLANIVLSTSHVNMLINNKSSVNNDYLVIT